MMRRTPVPQPAAPRRSALVRPDKPGLSSGAAPVQRHDLPLANWDVRVIFEDGTDEVLLVHARDPISAVRTASYTTEREWSAERLLSVRRISVKRG